jgi:hypothetical protein
MRLRRFLDLLRPSWPILVVVGFYELAYCFISLLGLLRSSKAFLILAVPGAVHLCWDFEVFEFAGLGVAPNILITLGTFYGAVLVVMPFRVDVGSMGYVALFVIAVAAMVSVNLMLGRPRKQTILYVDSEALASTEIAGARDAVEVKPNLYKERLRAARLESPSEFVYRIVRKTSLLSLLPDGCSVLLRPFFRPLSLVVAHRRFRSMELSALAWSTFLVAFGIVTVMIAGLGIGGHWLPTVELIVMIAFGINLIFTSQANAGVPPYFLGPMFTVASAFAALRVLQGSTVAALAIVSAVIGDMFALGGEVIEDGPSPPGYSRRWASGMVVAVFLGFIGTKLGEWLGSSLDMKLFHYSLLVICLFLCGGSAIAFGFARDEEARAMRMFVTAFLVIGVGGIVLIGVAGTAIQVKEMLVVLLSMCGGYAGSVLTNLTGIRSIHRKKVGAAFHIVRRIDFVRVTTLQIFGVGLATFLYASLAVKLSTAISVGMAVLVIAVAGIFTFRLVPWAAMTLLVSSLRLHRALLPGRTKHETQRAFRRRVARYAQALFVPVPGLLDSACNLSPSWPVSRALGALNAFAGTSFESRSVASKLRGLDGMGRYSCEIMQWASSRGFLAELMSVGRRHATLRAVVRLFCIVGNTGQDPFARKSRIVIRAKGQVFEFQSSENVSASILVGRIQEDLAVAEQLGLDTNETVQTLRIVQRIEEAKRVPELLAIMADLEPIRLNSCVYDSPRAYNVIVGSLSALEDVLISAQKLSIQRLKMEQRAWLYEAIGQVEGLTDERHRSFAILVVLLLLTRAKDLCT